MVAARVFGNNSTVTWCGANGHLELNVFMPVMARSVMESIRLLANVCKIFRERCIDGIEPNTEHCNELIEYSLAMVTSLAPAIGYEVAAKIAKDSVITGKTVRQLCIEQLDELGISADQLDTALNPASMT